MTLSPKARRWSLLAAALLLSTTTALAQPAPKPQLTDQQIAEIIVQDSQQA
jgi:hypothetical protein